MAYTDEFHGGYGILPNGQSVHGNASSPIEPRFLSSTPPDTSLNVPLDQFLKFTTYCYSSWVELLGVTVEISEDAGDTYNTAFTATTGFISPYDGPNSKALRTAGHEVSFYIQKVSAWPKASKIMIRFTGVDEHGQETTKESPVVW